MNSNSNKFPSTLKEHANAITGLLLSITFVVLPPLGAAWWIYVTESVDHRGISRWMTYPLMLLTLVAYSTVWYLWVSWAIMKFLI